MVNNFVRNNDKRYAKRIELDENVPLIERLVKVEKYSMNQICRKLGAGYDHYVRRWFKERRPDLLVLVVENGQQRRKDGTYLRKDFELCRASKN